MARDVPDAELVDTLLARIPAEARHALQDILGPLGRDIVSEQQALAPVLAARRPNRVPGYIRSQLRAVVDIDNLRVVAGLVDFKGGRDPRYYARWVQYGRRAGKKQVSRTIPGSAVQVGNAKVRARSSYTMEWPSIAPRNFIHLERSALGLAEKYLGHFWEDVLARSGASVG